MSTYYDFYLAVKKDDKIEAIGPYVRKEGEYRLVPIVSRSRSGRRGKRPGRSAGHAKLRQEHGVSHPRHCS